MVRGWLPAGAAHTAHAHSEAHQTSALPDSQREHRRRCPPLGSSWRNGEQLEYYTLPGRIAERERNSSPECQYE